jgi:hypothetical protein
MRQLSGQSMVSDAAVTVARALRIGVLGAAVLASTATWALPSISYVAVDEADVVMGQDLWRYDYTLTGPVDLFGGLEISFEAGLYEAVIISGADPILDVSTPTTQPDPIFGPGLVVVTLPTVALGAGDAGLFSVNFLWNGPGAPGSQSYRIFDGSFGDVVLSRTVPTGTSPIPAPSAASLVLLALAALATTRRARAQGQRR